MVDQPPRRNLRSKNRKEFTTLVYRFNSSGVRTKQKTTGFCFGIFGVPTGKSGGVIYLVYSTRYCGRSAEKNLQIQYSSHFYVDGNRNASFKTVRT